MATEACPVCPASFERDTAQDAENAVIAHAVSKNDDEHRGIGYEKASQMLRISDASETDPDPDPTGGAGGGDTVSAGVETTERADLATDGGPRDPPEPDAPVETDGGEDVDEVDDVPDRYTEVGEWCDRVENQHDLAGDPEWRDLRPQIEAMGDYVDEQETSGGDVEVVPEAEI